MNYKHKNYDKNHGGFIVALALAALLPHHAALAAQAPVGLGAAGNYAILAKTGISTVPPSVVTGDIGVSPIDSTAITGFSLILDSTTRFATSCLLYTSPSPRD